jgi:hypothetical protein
VGALAVLILAGLTYGWAGRRILRSLIDDRGDAKVLGLGMVECQVVV